MTEERRPASRFVVQAPLKEGRVREENFDILPTHIPSGFLLVDHGEEPDLTRSATRQLGVASISHAERSEVLKPLEKAQEKSRADLLRMHAEYPGIRGYRDRELGREVQINPHSVDVFDEQLLDESLGEKTPDFVHKQDKISLVLESREERDSVLKSMRRMLKRRGHSKEEIDVILNVEHTVRVDAEALSVAADSGAVTLLDGAWTKKVDRIAIVPRKILSNREIAQAEEAARTPKS